MKILGIVLIVCSCAGAGITAAWHLQSDERLWRAWVTLLQRLHGSLRYTSLPIQALLATVKKEDLTPLRWLDTFADDEAQLACPADVQEQERAFARSFFALLGTTDLDGQLQHIEVHIQQAQQAAQAAHEKHERCAKAYMTMGVCVGLCIGLLLL